MKQLQKIDEVPNLSFSLSSSGLALTTLTGLEIVREARSAGSFFEGDLGDNGVGGAEDRDKEGLKGERETINNKLEVETKRKLEPKGGPLISFGEEMRQSFFPDLKK